MIVEIDDVFLKDKKEKDLLKKLKKFLGKQWLIQF